MPAGVLHSTMRKQPPVRSEAGGPKRWKFQHRVFAENHEVLERLGRFTPSGSRKSRPCPNCPHRCILSRPNANGGQSQAHAEALHPQLRTSMNILRLQVPDVGCSYTACWFTTRDGSFKDLRATSVGRVLRPSQHGQRQCSLLPGILLYPAIRRSTSAHS
ncbi:hypothetical protein BJV74DRAFT_111560 [Russula compacta]|nr:hypothetical protein BJV74DRAFT_111560 [Russula compacta]